MIRRTYECSQCEKVFVFECNSDDPDPPCPNPDCDKVLDWRPQSFSIGGSNEGKAVALAQDIMEKDYGLSDFKDNNKPGEVGIKPHIETKAETELVNQTMSEMAQQTAGNPDLNKAFWGGTGGTPTTLSSMTGQSLIQMAKVGPASVDPIGALHNLARKGNINKHPSSMIREGYRADMQNPARKPNA